MPGRGARHVAGVPVSLMTHRTQRRIYMALERAYDELWSYWYLQCADGDGDRPSCVCDLGDSCPAHRCHAAMMTVYMALMDAGSARP